MNYLVTSCVSVDLFLQKICCGILHDFFLFCGPFVSLKAVGCYL